MRRVRESLWNVGRLLPFRGKVRIANLLAPRSGVHQARLFGYDVVLDLTNFIDRMVYMGCYEPLNTYRFRRILREGMTVVDAGANIGYFTLLAASRVGRSGKVVAIEPFPSNFDILASSVKANALSQVTAWQYGLGSTEGFGRVSQADQKVFNNRTASMAGEPNTGIRVEVRTLDRCMADWGLEHIDLLKIDVDGFETRILEGASETLSRRRIKNMIIELNGFWLERSGSSAAAVCAALLNAGFRDMSDHERTASLLLGPVDDRHFQLEQ